MQLYHLGLAGLALALAACASQNTSSSTAGSTPTALQASPECQAAKLRTAEPLPASAIPDEVLRKARTGYVVVRYDVEGGKARNAKVVASEPAGLYDGYVLEHASAYTEPTGASVRGCIMTTHIKF